MWRSIDKLRERLHSLNLRSNDVRLVKDDSIPSGLDHLIQSCSQAVWMTNAKGQIVEDSPTWRNFTGQSAEDWLNNRWIEVVHPDDREQATRV